MKTIVVAAKLSEVGRIREFLRANLGPGLLDGEDFFRLELAVVEVCINISRYAYRDVPGDIVLGLGEEPGPVVVEIRDSGIPFDPRTAPAPDLGKIMAAGGKGGLGIHLARRMVDKFDYRRENGQNVLTLTKKVSARAGGRPGRGPAGKGHFS